MSALLRLDGLEAGYGDLTAISGVSLEVRPGEAVTLIGSNGAGKTTTLRAISGLLPLRAGRIEFEGARHDDRPRRAERAAGAPALAPRLRPRERPQRARGHAGQPPDEPSRQAGVSRSLKGGRRRPLDKPARFTLSIRAS